MKEGKGRFAEVNNLGQGLFAGLLPNRYQTVARMIRAESYPGEFVFLVL
jgi:hypothetical protein